MTVADNRVVLGIDVGGTKTLLGLVDAGGKVLARREWITRDAYSASDVDHLGSMVEQSLIDLLQDGSPCASVSIAAIGVGCPEYVDANGQLTSNEVISWQEQPSVALAASAVRALGLDVGHIPVHVESDVRAGAIGEMLFGAASDVSSFVYVSLGTGLSSTIGVNGVVLPGHRGEAIALGEWPVSGANFDALGATNLEQYASGSGLSARFAALTGEQLDTREINIRALRSSGIERDFLQDAGKVLARALDSIVSFIDPERIVLGGGLGTAEGVLADALDAECATLLGRRPKSPALVRAQNGPLSGLLGAAATGWAAAQR